MASLKVTYLKGFGIEITDKFIPYIQGNRVKMEDAYMPYGGRHSVEVYLEDLDGNASRRTFTIQYAP
jgi:hypothetical protein